MLPPCANLLQPIAKQSNGEIEEPLAFSDRDWRPNGAFYREPEKVMLRPYRDASMDVEAAVTQYRPSRFSSSNFVITVELVRG
jgi:hypothetical protein